MEVRQDRHIHLTEKTIERLERYLKRNFGGHRALSMICEKAIIEYLDRAENKASKE